MPKSQELMLGAMVAATDGICGLVRSLMVDPSVPRVAHLLVEPEHRLGLGRLVPVELVEDVDEQAHDGIDLSCDLAMFGGLPSGETSHVVQGVGTGYDYFPPPPPMRLEVQDSAPVGECAVGEGSTVWASDGEVGKVAGFVTGPGYGIVEVLVKEPRFLWGHRTVAFPVSCIVGFKAGVQVSFMVDEAATVASAHRG